MRLEKICSWRGEGLEAGLQGGWRKMGITVKRRENECGELEGQFFAVIFKLTAEFIYVLYSDMLIIIHYLTMNKLIILLLIVLAVCSLQFTETHDQAAKPATSAAPASVSRQPHKEPGNPSVAGNPFGKDTQGHRTCFTPPCYDPTEPCTVTVHPAPAPAAAPAASTPAAGQAAAAPAAPVKHAHFQATAAATPAKPATTTPAPTQAAPTTRPGTWSPILFVVHINGKTAKYLGYVCK